MASVTISVEISTRTDDPVDFEAFAEAAREYVENELSAFALWWVEEDFCGNETEQEHDCDGGTPWVVSS